MKKFNLFLCSSLILSCLASSASFADPTNLTDLPGDVLLLIGQRLNTRADLTDMVCTSKVIKDKMLGRKTGGDVAVVKLVSDSLEPKATVWEVPIHKVPAEFKAIGNGKVWRIKDPTGQAPSFYLSDDAKVMLDHRHAAGWDDEDGHHQGYCEEKGLRLANVDELRVLSRAMGNPTGRYEDRAGYKSNLIPGIKNSGRFWSGSVHPDDHFVASYFNGSDGYVDYYHRYGLRSVRCVRGIAAEQRPIQ